MTHRVPRLPEEEGYWYPDWRALWEESLDATARERIARAVRLGLPVTDPLEARFAVTLADRDRRIWRWWPLFSLVYVGAAVTFLVFLSRIPVAAWAWSEWLLAASAGTVVLIFPWLARRRYRRSVTAELLNRGVLVSGEIPSP